MRHRASPAPEPTWGSWDPVARTFHEATKDLYWLTDDQARQLAAAQRLPVDQPPPPPPCNRPRGRGIALPVTLPRGEFVRTLLERRTWRGFGRRPLSRRQLGLLLDLTFGVRMRGVSGSGARVVFTTSPSPGATHPIEAYVLAVHVRGVPPGLYHYSCDTRRLHVVRRGATRGDLVEYLSGQTWFGDASALIIMTGVLARARWRYAHPRAYRSVLLAAGHVCQTFCLVATWLGLAPFCTQAMPDSRVERDLRIDGSTEVVLYAAGVGTRPPDGRWVQWPAENREGAATRTASRRMK